MRCLTQALRPLARFCLRYGITVQDAFEEMNVAFVQEAANELRSHEVKVTTSRICAATGVHRQKIVRILAGDAPRSIVSYSQRIIGAWRGTKAYIKAGAPRPLTCDSDDSEFHKLVRAHCNDVHPRTLLFELERVGAVERVGDTVQLVQFGYTPKGNPEEGFRLFADDAGFLLQSVHENVLEGVRPPHLHVRTEFDNINQMALPEIRQWMYKAGNEFHEKVRKYLSRFDLDLNPKKQAQGGAHVALCSFSFVDNSPKIDSRDKAEN